MKKIAVILLVAAVGVIAQQVGLKDRMFRVRSSADLKGAVVRVSSGEFFPDRTATLKWEVYGTNSLIVSRGSLALDRPALRQWMNSDEPVLWLRTNVLNAVSLESDE